MKERKLTGVYVRAQDEDGNWVSKDISDCSETQQRLFLDKQSKTWVIEFCLIMLRVLRELGETLDLERIPQQSKEKEGGPSDGRFT